MLIFFFYIYPLALYSKDININIISLTNSDNPNNINSFLPSLPSILTKSGSYCDFPFTYNSTTYFDHCISINAKFYCKTSENTISECLLNTSLNEYYMSAISSTLNPVNDDIYDIMKKDIYRYNDDRLILLYNLCDSYCHSSHLDMYDCLYDNLLLPISNSHSHDELLSNLLMHFTSFKNSLQVKIENQNKYLQYEYIIPNGSTMRTAMFNKFIRMMKFVYGKCNEECKNGFDFIFEEYFNKTAISYEIASKLLLLDHVETNFDSNGRVKYRGTFYEMNESLRQFVDVSHWSSRYALFILYRYIIMEKNFMKEIIKGEMTEDAIFTSDSDEFEILTSFPITKPYHKLSIDLLDKIQEVYERYHSVTKKAYDLYKETNELMTQSKEIITKSISDIDNINREIRRMVNQIDSLLKNI